MDNPQARVNPLHLLKILVQIAKQEASHIVPHGTGEASGNVEEGFSPP